MGFDTANLHRRTLPTTKPVKKKLTQAAVSICGTIMLRFFFSMSVIMDGSVIQGLTLVHFSAQLERFLWDRGCR